MSDMPERLLAWPSGHNYQRVSLAGGSPNDAVEYVRANAIPAVQPTVKPLVWEQITIPEQATQGIWWRAAALTGNYEVHQFNNRDEIIVFLQGRGMGNPEYPTIEAAKAAAQADYEARILSALDMQPTVSPEQPVATTDVAALVETLDRTTSHGQRSEYSRVGHHLNEASWHVHLAGFKSRDDAEAFLAAALARVKGVM